MEQETGVFLIFGADTDEYKMHLSVYWLAYLKVKNDLQTFNMLLY